MDNQDSAWICCQLGAREYYAIPRALHRTGQLKHLITDAWVKPDSLFKKLPVASLRNLGDRHHIDLHDAPVSAFTNQLVLFETRQRLQKTKPWPRMIARNDWYQEQVIQKLKQIDTKKFQTTPILFTYSYAALEILRYAKAQGWKTILGQIDPGIEEEKIVLEEFKKHPELAPDWRPVPSQYWQNWHRECELTDYILVNSEWSKKLLTKAGIIEGKIKIVPLVYQVPEAAKSFERLYPKKFTGDRPLRILFLGLITLRKGIAPYLQAIEKLKGEPIEFWFVGSQQIQIPESFRANPQIKWIGPVSRSETPKYYQQADIFCFPTLSDGFGLTQLEAQAWKLPLITSKFCGEVVSEGKNGLLLESNLAAGIVEKITFLKDNPKQLLDFSKRSVLSKRFSINSLSQALFDLHKQNI